MDSTQGRPVIVDGMPYRVPFTRALTLSEALAPRGEERMEFLEAVGNLGALETDHSPTPLDYARLRRLTTPEGDPERLAVGYHRAKVVGGYPVPEDFSQPLVPPLAFIHDAQQSARQHWAATSAAQFYLLPGNDVHFAPLPWNDRGFIHHAFQVFDPHWREGTFCKPVPRSHPGETGDVLSGPMPGDVLSMGSAHLLTWVLKRTASPGNPMHILLHTFRRINGRFV